MTQYTIKTTRSEADQIQNGTKSFVFRSDRKPYQAGDIVSFLVYDRQKPVRHTIDKMKFVITYTSKDSPVRDGFMVIGFRRMS